MIASLPVCMPERVLAAPAAHISVAGLPPIAWEFEAGVRVFDMPLETKVRIGFLPDLVTFGSASCEYSLLRGEWGSAGLLCGLNQTYVVPAFDPNSIIGQFESSIFGDHAEWIHPRIFVGGYYQLVSGDLEVRLAPNFMVILNSVKYSFIGFTETFILSEPWVTVGYSLSENSKVFLRTGPAPLGISWAL